MISESGVLLVDRLGSRHRLVNALKGKFTGEVPFQECYVDIEHVEHVLGRPIRAKMLQRAQSLYAKKDEYGYESSFNLPPKDYVEFLLRTGMDAAYLSVPWFVGRLNKRDSEGRINYVDGTIKSHSDLDQIEPPPLQELKRNLEEFLAAAHDTELGVIATIDTSPSIANTAIGPIDYLYALYDTPEFVHELMDILDDYIFQELEVILEYPVDNIWLGGIKSAAAGSLISYEMHSEFVFPRLEKLLEVIHPTGIPVTLHADGKIESIMDWIISVGFSAINPIEPPAMDIYSLKKQYGNRICLWGNIDLNGVLRTGTPEQVATDVLYHIKQLAPGGGYVCSSSHEITREISPENFAALAKTICSTIVSPEGELIPSKQRF